MVFAQVPRHRVGHPERQAPALAGAAAQVRPGDGQRRRVQKERGGPVGRLPGRGSEAGQAELPQHLDRRGRLRIEAHAVPRDHHEAGEGDDALGVPPVQQIEEGLGADDQVQAPAVLQRGQGVHRVGGPAPRDLDVGDLEARVLAHREGGHPVAVGGGRQLGERLVGRLGRRHQQETIELERLADLVGHE